MFVPTVGPVDRALQRRRAFYGPLTRLLNPSIRRLAGRSGVPLLGLLYHQGRRSGRSYLTPVGVGLSGATFLIPLTFGTTADWCRNVLAAGGCSITWHGRLYTADQAEVVDDVVARAEVQAAFGRLPRLLFRLMGLHQFLRLRRR
jgi:deazaflavin-dependent oxidoreductase (nitroreductase family)